MAFELFEAKEKAEKHLKAELELIKSRKIAESYLEIAAEIIISLDFFGNITLLNDSGYKLLGYEKGELLSRNWFDTCIPSHITSDIKNVFNKLMAGEIEEVKYYENEVIPKSFHFVTFLQNADFISCLYIMSYLIAFVYSFDNSTNCWYITKNNEIKVIYWDNTLLYDENRKITGLLSSGKDYSERKKIEIELKETADTNTRILESISDGFFVLNQEMVVEYYNHMAEKLLGKYKDEVIGNKLFDVFKEARGSIFEEKCSYALKEQKKCSF